MSDMTKFIYQSSVYYDGKNRREMRDYIFFKGEMNLSITLFLERFKSGFKVSQAFQSSK